MNGKEISHAGAADGVIKLTVSDFVSKSERVPKGDNYNNLFVKNLPDNFTEEELCAKFASFGEL